MVGHVPATAGAYSHFMSCTIMADMLPSLSTLRQVRNSISIVLVEPARPTLFPPLLIIRKCVFPFPELHNAF